MPTQSPPPPQAGGAVMTFWLLLSILTLVTTFGVGTALNMIFRRWWIAVVIALLLSVYILVRAGAHLIAPEWILLVIGWIGTALAAWAVRALKRNGYPLFS